MTRRTGILQMLAVSIGLFVTARAEADSVTGGQLTSWNPNYLYGYPSYTPGLSYWNNNSGDGSQANIGWCLIGGGQCTMPGPPGLLPYYSVSFTAPSTFFFTSSGHPATATLQASITDQKGAAHGYDVFGYYLTDPNGTPVAGTAQALFTSNDASGSSSVLNLAAGTDYGFFVENIQGSNTPFQTTYWFGMNASSNVASGSLPADPIQHFSVFQSTSSYYLGADDADACINGFQPTVTPCVPASQFDYNDLIVKLDTSTPEPASLLLVGGGVFLLGCLRQYRRKV